MSLVMVSAATQAAEVKHVADGPPPGTETPVHSRIERDPPPRRGDLVAAQLRHAGDWQVSPQAMRNLMRHIRSEDIQVSAQTKRLSIDDKDIFDYKLIYLTGSSSFDFGAKDLTNIRFNLDLAGAMLLADSHCGSGDFDKSFRDFASKLFPGRPLEPVSMDDPIFGKRMNFGAQLDLQTIKCRGEDGGLKQCTPPLLEGIKNKDGRWAVLYSRYDLGTGLENRRVNRCQGFEPDSAMKVGSAAVHYLFMR